MSGTNDEPSVTKRTGKYKCDRCTSYYVLLSSLNRHKLTKHGIHPAEPEVSCPYCKVELPSSGKLYNHIRLYCKKVPKPYPCDQCSKTFSSKYNLAYHQRSHTNPKNYPNVCPDCNTGFKLPTVLRKHMEAEGHGDASSVPAADESKKRPRSDNAAEGDTSSDTDLSASRGSDCTPSRPPKTPKTSKSSTPGSTSNNKKKTSSSSRGKKGLFICKKCKLTYSFAESMYMHQSVEHAEMFPYHCGECHRGFSVRRKLKEHERKCDGDTWNDWRVKKRPGQKQSANAENGGEDVVQGTLLLFHDQASSELANGESGPGRGQGQGLSSTRERQNGSRVVLKGEIMPEREPKSEREGETKIKIGPPSALVGGVKPDPRALATSTFDDQSDSASASGGDFGISSNLLRGVYLPPAFSNPSSAFPASAMASARWPAAHQFSSMSLPSSRQHSPQRQRGCSGDSAEREHPEPSNSQTPIPTSASLLPTWNPPPQPHRSPTGSTSSSSASVHARAFWPNAFPAATAAQQHAFPSSSSQFSPSTLSRPRCNGDLPNAFPGAAGRSQQSSSSPAPSSSTFDPSHASSFSALAPAQSSSPDSTSLSTSSGAQNGSSNACRGHPSAQNGDNVFAYRQTFEVERILDRAHDANNPAVKLYRVKWVGLPESQNTWEPVENLQSVKWMVQDFDRICDAIAPGR